MCGCGLSTEWPSSDCEILEIQNGTLSGSLIYHQFNDPKQFNGSACGLNSISSRSE